MIANAPVPDTAEGRIAGRSNVFVVATLYCAAGSGAVRIRNLSSSGALVEGSVLPLRGSRVRLSRGSLQVSGEIAWSADGKAGVRFGSSIAVAEWLPGAGPASGQQNIDEIVFRAKSGPPAGGDTPPPMDSQPSNDVAFELGVLASGLTRLCEQLAEDPHVAARFPDQLQMIEATAKRLDRLASAALPAP